MEGVKISSDLKNKRSPSIIKARGIDTDKIGSKLTEKILSPMIVQQL